MELEVQLLRANAEAQAIALQGIERERAMAEQLLQAKEELMQSQAAAAQGGCASEGGADAVTSCGCASEEGAVTTESAGC
jgi:hypothetical protein